MRRGAIPHPIFRFCCGHCVFDGSIQTSVFTWKEWEKKDPIPRFQTYLKDKGLLSDEDIIQLETEIAEEVQGVVDRAEKRMQEEVDPLGIFDHTFAELPSSLVLQRREMEHELSLIQEEANHD